MVKINPRTCEAHGTFVISLDLSDLVHTLNCFDGITVRI